MRTDAEISERYRAQMVQGEGDRGSGKSHVADPHARAKATDREGGFWLTTMDPKYVANSARIEGFW